MRRPDEPVCPLPGGLAERKVASHPAAQPEERLQRATQLGSHNLGLAPAVLLTQRLAVPGYQLALPFAQSLPTQRQR